jgi:hypothetical protein
LFCIGSIRFPASVTAVQALADGWAWLCWPAVAFHLGRPFFRLGSISGAGGLSSFLAGRLGAHIHDPAAPDDLSRFGAHGTDYSRYGAGLAIHDP